MNDNGTASVLTSAMDDSSSYIASRFEPATHEKDETPKAKATPVTADNDSVFNDFVKANTRRSSPETKRRKYRSPSPELSSISSFSSSHERKPKHKHNKRVDRADRDDNKTVLSNQSSIFGKNTKHDKKHSRVEKKRPSKQATKRSKSNNRDSDSNADDADNLSLGSWDKDEKMMTSSSKRRKRGGHDDDDDGGEDEFDMDKDHDDEDDILQAEAADIARGGVKNRLLGRIHTMKNGPYKDFLPETVHKLTPATPTADLYMEEARLSALIKKLKSVKYEADVACDVTKIGSKLHEVVPKITGGSTLGTQYLIGWDKAVDSCKADLCCALDQKYDEEGPWLNPSGRMQFAYILGRSMYNTVQKNMELEKEHGTVLQAPPKRQCIRDSSMHSVIEDVPPPPSRTQTPRFVPPVPVFSPPKPPDNAKPAVDVTADDSVSVVSGVTVGDIRLS